LQTVKENKMNGSPELLLKFDISILEIEYRRLTEEGGTRSSTHEKTEDQLRLAIAREFVEFIREFVSEEFGLGIFVEVHHVSADGMIGLVDFPADRQSALAKVEKRVRQACGKVPEPCRAGRPILDRLLSCMEIVRAPDHADDALDALKRECTVRFSTDGSLANSGARADTAEGYFFG
jgi:hypothetical protein